MRLRLNVPLPGPFSVSMPLGGQRTGERTAHTPMPLAQVADALRAEGWRVAGPDRGPIVASKGWMAMQLTADRGGTTARRVTSRRTLTMWALLAAAAIIALSIAGY